ncbi:MAG: MFS transporter [Bacteroidia bacterium]|nr:MFS transporter [Bacteroidia bacterium]
MKARLHHSPLNLAVFVAGLGFFVDAFDLFLFNIYRIPSLKDLGLSGKDLTSYGENLLAIQMAGMMIGGIVTGMIGDKKGRVSVLFGSILLYSVSNMANAFVYDIQSYAVVRFFAGLGLAGELGAGIALVSESMSIENRGYGTIMVATLGAIGAVTAGLIGNIIPWRMAFLGAGILGLLLLFLRMKTMETDMFQKTIQNPIVKKGSFSLLFSSRSRTIKYLACILMGVPIWYSVGLLITLSPEIASLYHIEGLQLGTCFILFQVGITLGDLSSGMLSQLLKTRKKIIFAYMLFAIAATVLHFLMISRSKDLYITSLLMGTGCGYLSVYVTATAEHFGTNLRVLVSATVTNFMRGAVTILVPLHVWMEKTWQLNLVESLSLTGMLVWLLALASVMLLPETYGKNLEYTEK